jgi:predicted nucleic acid-binding protein
MILADTSIWITHLRSRIDPLGSLLEEGQVVCHPIVVGELACGSFQRRNAVLDMIQALPQLMEVGNDEVMTLIEVRRLMGSGIGWSDAHLLAASMLGDVRLWTMDRHLAEAAHRLGVHASL